MTDNARARAKDFWYGAQGRPGPLDIVATKDAPKYQGIDAKEHAALSWDCLMMIRDLLEKRGIDMTSTPPMMYPEAIMALVKREVMRDRRRKRRKQ